MRRAKRGHTNLIPGEPIGPWSDCPDKARLPIQGGATVTTCKEFPPLALLELKP